MGYQKLHQVLRILQLIGLTQATLFFSSSQNNRRAELPNTACSCVRPDQCPAIIHSMQKNVSLGTSAPCENTGFVRCCDASSRNIVRSQFTQQSRSQFAYVNQKKQPPQKGLSMTETRYRESLRLPEGIVVPLPVVYPEYVDRRNETRNEKQESTTGQPATRTLPPGIVAPSIGFVYPEYLDKIKPKNEGDRKKNIGGENVDLQRLLKKVDMTIWESVRDAISSDKRVMGNQSDQAITEKLVKIDVMRHRAVQRLPESATPPSMGLVYPDRRKNVGVAVDSRRKEEFRLARTRTMSRTNIGASDSSTTSARIPEVKNSTRNPSSIRTLTFDNRVPLLFALPLYVNDLKKKMNVLQTMGQGRSLNFGENVRLESNDDRSVGANKNTEKNIRQAWRYHERHGLPVDKTEILKPSSKDPPTRYVSSSHLGNFSPRSRDSLSMSDRSDQLQRLGVLGSSVKDRKDFFQGADANYTIFRTVSGNTAELKPQVLLMDRKSMTGSVKNNDKPEETDVLDIKATVGRAEDRSLGLSADFRPSLSSDSFESLKERDSSGSRFTSSTKTTPITVHRGYRVHFSNSQESLRSPNRRQPQRESTLSGQLRVSNDSEVLDNPRKHERDLQNATDGFKNINHALMVISNSVTRDDFLKAEEPTNPLDNVTEKSRDNVSDINESTNIEHVPPAGHSENETSVTAERIITLANLLAGVNRHDIDDPEVKETLSTLDEEKVKFGSRVESKFTNRGSAVAKESPAGEKRRSKTFTSEEASVHPEDDVTTKLTSDTIVPFDGRPMNSKLGNYSRLSVLYGDAARKRNFRGKSIVPSDPDLEVTTSGEFLRNVFKDTNPGNVRPFRRTVLRRRPVVRKDTIDDVSLEGKVTNLRKVDSEARSVNGDDNNNDSYLDSIIHLNLVMENKDASSIMMKISPETHLESESPRIRTNKDSQHSVELTPKISALPILDITLNTITDTTEDVASKSTKMLGKMTLESQEDSRNSLRSSSGSTRNTASGSSNRESSNGTNDGRYFARRRQRLNRKSTTTENSMTTTTMESLETTKTPRRRPLRIMPWQRTLQDQEMDHPTVHDREENSELRGSSRQRSLRMTTVERGKTLSSVESKPFANDSTQFQISSLKIDTPGNETTQKNSRSEVTTSKIDNLDLKLAIDGNEKSGLFNRNLDEGFVDQLVGMETSTSVSVVRNGMILTKEEIEKLESGESRMGKNRTEGSVLREVVDDFVSIFDSNSSTSTLKETSSSKIKASEAGRLKDESARIEDIDVDGNLNKGDGASRTSNSTVLTSSMMTRCILENVDEASKELKGSENNNQSEVEKNDDSDKV